MQSFFKEYKDNNTEISLIKCTIFKTFQFGITKFQPKLIQKKYIKTHNYFLLIILRKKFIINDVKAQLMMWRDMNHITKKQNEMLLVENLVLNNLKFKVTISAHI